MGAATVRAAITSYFAGAALTGLQHVYQECPWWLDGDQFDLAGGDDFGAVAYVHLSEQRETRIALPAVQGIKAVTWDVALVVLFQYLVPSSFPAGQDESSWVTPLDALLDGLIARLRADQTLGTGHNGVIFQAGESVDDVVLRRDLPRIDAQGGKVWCWQVLEFKAVEMIQA